MARLKFNSDEIELFCINIISNSYDKKYLDLNNFNGKDNFDFMSEDQKIVLEVTLIISNNIIEVLKYENAQSKGKQPNKNKIKDAKYDSNEMLIRYHGATMDEIEQKMENAIIIKNSKAISRKNKKNNNASSYELCLAVNEGGLFNTTLSIVPLKKFINSNNFIFNKYFIITRCNFFVIEENTIKEYKRTIGGVQDVEK